MHKQHSKCYPPIPKSIDEILIPQELGMTKKGEQFILFNALAESSQYIMFSTQSNMNLLSEADHLFMDGTFKVTPSIFFQLYTIHCLIENVVIPCIYISLPSKNQSIYDSIFQKLVELKPHLNPESITVDFEIAAINAIKKIFPETKIQGCLFHFGQNIHRHIQSSGLQQLYNTDNEIAIQARMVNALAFVPPNSINSAFSTLISTIRSELFPIMEYFEDTYIGRRIGPIRKTPIFSIDIWNVYERTIDNLPRTNNALEGWHKALQTRISTIHPNFWKFLDFIKEEQAMTEVKLAQINAGMLIKHSKKKYIDLNDRIRLIVSSFHTRNIIEYLKSIAINLKL